MGAISRTWSIADRSFRSAWIPIDECGSEDKMGRESGEGKEGVSLIFFYCCYLSEDKEYLSGAIDE